MNPAAREREPSSPLHGEKIFCIGFNKTGTTSVRVALEELGYKVGNQPEAEMFVDDWARRDFARIIDYCSTADAFQDIPFSLPFTYQAVDAAFPGSRFILTVRADSEVWYRSLKTFHAKLFGEGRTPSVGDLARADYRFKGWALLVMEKVFACPTGDPYDKECLVRAYETHNAMVREYFRHRPADLLMINLAARDAYHQFCAFLGKPAHGRGFPWLNRSS